VSEEDIVAVFVEAIVDSEVARKFKENSAPTVD
jgi:hypothetical protein